jgi:hypothetical protein
VVAREASKDESRTLGPTTTRFLVYKELQLRNKDII